LPSYGPPKLVESKGIEGFPPRTSQNPRATRSPKSSPFSHGFGRGIKGKRITKGSYIHPPTNAQENVLEISSKKIAKKRLRKSSKRKIGKNSNKP
jgi:hypothetical protein